ncbi:MAG: hypothetical protein LBS11_09590 [Oscillospiraceae bacterium]|jgi:ABC-2 type transport system permease protein|nr:hypothetical protein [Oscillospiraceae bacterium]
MTTAGYARYSRFIIRRERVVGLIWLLAMPLAAFGLASLYPGLLPTPESLLSMASTMNTPAMVAMMGPVYGLDSLTPAIAMSQECLIWFAIASILMNIFFVNRHTRVDEELGRHEMFAALPVGRLAGGASVIVDALVMDVVITILTALLLIALDVGGTTAAGAFAYASSIGAQGFLFAAVTLLTAQLFSTAHGSMGAAFAFMGISYIMRASGDVSGGALSLISPMGLGLKVQAFYANAFWPIAALIAEAVAVAALALVVNARRDVGSGVFPARKGRDSASRFLQSPLGLAWRLSRGTFIAWAVAFLTLGAMYGAVLGELDSFVEGNDVIRRMLEGQLGAKSLVDAYIPLLGCVMALIASIPVVNTVNRLRAEERRGRLEQVYARAASRRAMFAGFAAIAAAEAVVFTFLSAFGLYVSASGTGLVSLGAIMGASFAYVPAILTLAAVAAMLVGIAPRLTALTWALFGYSFIMMYFGRLFDMPTVLPRLSPFSAVPQLPVEAFRAVPIAVMCGLSALMCGVGLAGYRERDTRY